MRNINLDLVRVTEAGAIAASRYVGSGDKLSADEAATTAIRNRLNKMRFAGKVVIGEGIKDNGESSKYGLYTGECVGELGTPQEPSAGSAGEFELSQKIKPKFYDLALDPIEGTTPTVTSGPEAMSVIAVADEGSMYYTSHHYMKKLAYGPKISEKVELRLNDPLERTIELVSLATGKQAEHIMVCILDRPRHHAAIKELRELGVRIKLIRDCDVSGALSACLNDNEVDLLYGIGGSPEAVLTACAIKCLGGGLQAQVWEKKNEEEWEAQGNILNLNDLVNGECIFAATGITNGGLLQGVRWTNRGPVTNSVFMRSHSGTLRWLVVEHGN
jgi:fructose-1,6-bisphosphatase II